RKRFNGSRKRVARNPGCRPNRYRATDVGIDRVRLVQDIAQDIADDVTQIGAFEVERDRWAGGDSATRRRSRKRTTGKLPLHELAIAFEYPRTLFGRRWRRGCRGGIGSADGRGRPAWLGAYRAGRFRRRARGSASDDE